MENIVSVSPRSLWERCLCLLVAISAITNALSSWPDLKTHIHTHTHTPTPIYAHTYNHT